MPMPSGCCNAARTAVASSLNSWSVTWIPARQTFSLNDIDRRTVLTAARADGSRRAGRRGRVPGRGGAVAAPRRRWYRRADLPPQDLAKLKWEQAKAAAGAGAGAWRDTESKVYVPRSARATS